jgi:hypothetical protein
MVIRVESLDSMFGHNIPAKHLSYEGACHNCGHDVEVEITKTVGGYGLLGGVLYESNPNKFLLLCGRCFEKTAYPITGQDYSI